MFNGRSTEVSTPWGDMLKESMIRSLYRDSDKLIQTEDEENWVIGVEKSLGKSWWLLESSCLHPGDKWPGIPAGFLKPNVESDSSKTVSYIEAEDHLLMLASW